MSHFTLASGTPTVTVSMTCPTCGTRRALTEHLPYIPLTFLPAHLLFCTASCRDAWAVMAPRAIAQHLPLFAEEYAFALSQIQKGVIPDAVAQRLQGLDDAVVW